MNFTSAVLLEKYLPFFRRLRNDIDTRTMIVARRVPGHGGKTERSAREGKKKHPGIADAGDTATDRAFSSLATARPTHRTTSPSSSPPPSPSYEFSRAGRTRFGPPTFSECDREFTGTAQTAVRPSVFLVVCRRAFAIGLLLFFSCFFRAR